MAAILVFSSNSSQYDSNAYDLNSVSSLSSHDFGTHVKSIVPTLSELVKGSLCSRFVIEIKKMTLAEMEGNCKECTEN